MTLKELYSIAIPNFFKNLRNLFKYNIEKDAIQNANFYNEIDILKEKLSLARKEIIELYFTLNPSEAEKYSEELNYVKETNAITPFPYHQLKSVKQPVCGIDEKTKLPFVIHNKKRLYFPADWSTENACKAYCNYIERENLLGGGYTAKAPHQYITNDFHVEEGDIVLDIGCAEALFALDSVEKAKKIYLLEADEKWFCALEATFRPYKEKVSLIKKFAGSTDNNTTTTLNSILSQFHKETFFVKMDIEGAEEEVLKSSRDFLTSDNKIKIACCTYHRAHHAETISQFLRSLNYDTEFSDGYMLFYQDPHQQPPYFRHGLIRCKKLF